MKKHIGKLKEQMVIILLISIGIFILTSTNVHSTEIPSEVINTDSNISLEMNESFKCSDCKSNMTIECDSDIIYIKCNDSGFKKIFLRRKNNPESFDKTVNAISTATKGIEFYYDGLTDLKCPICKKDSLSTVFVPIIIQNESGYMITVPNCGCNIITENLE